MTSGGQLSLDQGHGEAPSVERATKANHRRAKPRAWVEHVFGAQSPMGGMLVRTIGLARARIKTGMMNIAYNIR